MSDTERKIEVGQTASLKRVLSQEDVQTFANLSGDQNPIHVDPAFAATTIFKKPIVHGMLSASLISTALAMKLPGEGSVYMSQNLNFKLPVYVGEEVTVVLTVTNVRTDKPIVTLQTQVLNSKQRAVIEGEAVMYCPFLKKSSAT
jgi:acyl dehydratase